MKPLKQNRGKDSFSDSLQPHLRVRSEKQSEPGSETTGESSWQTMSKAKSDYKSVHSRKQWGWDSRTQDPFSWGWAQAITPKWFNTVSFISPAQPTTSSHRWPLSPNGFNDVSFQGQDWWVMPWPPMCDWYKRHRKTPNQRAHTT